MYSAGFSASSSFFTASGSSGFFSVGRAPLK